MEIFGDTQPTEIVNSMLRRTQEKRLKPWLNEIDQQTLSRCDRAMTQNMKVTSEDRESGVFRVKGKADEYEVKIASTPTCTCPDYQHRHKPCKHIMFVYLRVLNMKVDDALIWQQALLTHEVDAILSNTISEQTQPMPSDEDISDRVEIDDHGVNIRRAPQADVHPDMQIAQDLQTDTGVEIDDHGVNIRRAPLADVHSDTQTAQDLQTDTGVEIDDHGVNIQRAPQANLHPDMQTAQDLQTDTSSTETNNSHMVVSNGAMEPIEDSEVDTRPRWDTEGYRRSVQRSPENELLQGDQEMRTRTMATKSGKTKKKTIEKMCPHQKCKRECAECGGSQICKHKRRRRDCKECGGSRICEHKRIRTHCKECDGSQICQHRRRKTECTQCGGSQVCEHKRRRRDCKECHGSQICQHKRIRKHCKECDGSQICQHQRRRIECNQCGGSQICQHKRRRRDCVECGGSQICEHKRVRTDCTECGSVQICQHKRRKKECNQCGGSQICQHNRKRRDCVECGGSQICEHKRLRNNCKECGGSQICQHNRIRRNCQECNGSQLCQHNRRKFTCRICDGRIFCIHNRDRYKCKECPRCVICLQSAAAYGEEANMCLGCFRMEAVVRARPQEAELARFLENRAKIKTSRDMFLRKKPELQLKKFLSEMPGLEVVIHHDKSVLGADADCEGSRNRPDFQLMLKKIQEHLAIWVECDENQHKDPQYGCELKRVYNMYRATVDKKSVHVIRWNPHAFSTGYKSSKEAVNKNERNALLTNEIHKSVQSAEEGLPGYTLKITWICFDCNCETRERCGYVHTKEFKTCEEIQKEIDQGKQF